MKTYLPFPFGSTLCLMSMKQKPCTQTEWVFLKWSSSFCLQRQRSNVIKIHWTHLSMLPSKLKVLMWVYLLGDSLSNDDFEKVSDIHKEPTVHLEPKGKKCLFERNWPKGWYTLFLTSNTFISNVRLKLAKNQVNAKQHPLG